MNGLSDPTLAVLVEAASYLGRPDLLTMLMRADLLKYAPLKTGIEEESRDELILARLLGARDAHDSDAHRGLLAVATEMVQRTVQHPEHPPPWFGDLREALLADGYALTWEGALPRAIGTGGSSRFFVDGSIRYKILPTDAAPVPLPDQITALEAELAGRGYTSVLNHYQQAIDGFTHHKYESANGDLRTALEDLVTRLAEDHTGYQRQPRANQGGIAISHMLDSGHLPEDDGGLLLRGLWKLTHTNGSHPGQSDPDEARFRMQVITATARFLLNHFPAVT
jgi:hypothetical protein